MTDTPNSINDDPNRFLAELDLKDCKYLKLYRKYCLNKDEAKSSFSISTVFSIEQTNERLFE